jgi:hypothetical protein
MQATAVLGGAAGRAGQRSEAGRIGERDPVQVNDQRPPLSACTSVMPAPGKKPAGFGPGRAERSELSRAGRGREPPGERDDQAAELVRPLDDERPVDRGEHRGHPVEPLRPQVHAVPASGLRIRAGRLDARDAGWEPGPDLLGARLDPQRHLMLVRSLGEPGEHALGRVESGGRLE